MSARGPMFGKFDRRPRGCFADMGDDGEPVSHLSMDDFRDPFSFLDGHQNTAAVRAVDEKAVNAFAHQIADDVANPFFINITVFRKACDDWGIDPFKTVSHTESLLTKEAGIVQLKDARVADLQPYPVPAKNTSTESHRLFILIECQTDNR
jgi:hypothetical protein